MSKEAAKLRTVEGQPSFRLANGEVELFVTKTGGHMGPVTFDRKDRKIRPYSVAPWAKEKLPRNTPAIIRALRGDFFCLPFGGNDRPYRGEEHPVHGETANGNWAFEAIEKDANSQTLRLSLRTKVRKGRVEKNIGLKKGHNVVYVQHVVSGMSGPMNLGHHAMLKFPETPGSGLISTSPFVHAKTCPRPFENPADKGYSCLRRDAEFTKLSDVPTLDGGSADLTRFPLRKGYEDLVMLVADDSLPMAWTAVSFPEEGYAWFALRDPRVLRETIFWISNGGRHYEPWNGRHTAVMGIEDVTSYFHFGLSEAARKNDLSAKGYPTTLRLNAKRPLAVNYIMGVAKIPRGFGRVKRIEPDKGARIALVGEKGKAVKASMDVEFLGGA